MMKYMRQYKQKKKEKDEYFGFIAKISPLFKPLKITL